MNIINNQLPLPIAPNSEKAKRAIESGKITSKKIYDDWRTYWLIQYHIDAINSLINGESIQPTEIEKRWKEAEPLEPTPPPDPGPILSLFKKLNEKFLYMIRKDVLPIILENAFITGEQLNLDKKFHKSKYRIEDALRYPTTIIPAIRAIEKFGFIDAWQFSPPFPRIKKAEFRSKAGQAFFRGIETPQDREDLKAWDTYWLHRGWQEITAFALADPKYPPKEAGRRAYERWKKAQREQKENSDIRQGKQQTSQAPLPAKKNNINGDR